MSSFSKKNMHCGLCGHPNNGVFCALDQPIKDILNQEKTVQSYKKNQVIFQEGSPSYALFCIHSGKVKLYKTNENGNHQVIRILKPADIVGFRPLLSNEPYSATAETIEPTTLCLIPKETLLKMISSSKELAFELLSKLSIELRISEEQLVSLLHYPVRRRAATLLLSLIDSKFDITSGKHPKLSNLKRIEMAQIIGTTPETLSRTLKSFSDEKIITFDRKDIHVIDIQRLKRVAKDSRL